MFSVINKLLSVHENLPLGLFELSPQYTPFQYISANELNTFYSTLVDEVIAVIKTESNDLCSLNVLIIRH